MALTATKLSADRYSLKLSISQSGTDADVLEIVSATLLGYMVDGPLKDLWSLEYANTVAARDALADGSHASIFIASHGTTPGLAWCVRVSTPGNVLGRASLNIYGDPDASPNVVELRYWHSTGR